MSTTRLHPPGTTVIPGALPRHRGATDTPAFQVARSSWALARVIPGGWEAGWWLACLALVVIGWVAQTLIVYQPEAGGNLGSFLARATLELCWVGAGVVLGLGFRFLPANWRRPVAVCLLPVVLILLVIVFTQPAINGAHRWLRYGSWSFQPLELAKLSLILVGAFYFAPRLRRPERLQGVLSMGLIVALGILLLLVVAQPNVSGAAILFFLMLAFGFVGNLPRRLLGLIIIFTILASSVFLLLDEERSRRIFSATSDAAQVDHDIAEEAYQASQARFAVAQGGWIGVGPGHSTVKKTLPASENDFIFAILVEEYGVLGGLAILGAIFGLILTILHLSACCPDRFLQFVGFGIAAHWGLQTLIHLQVNLGGITTGVPLLFFSKGGSAALVLGIEIALIAMLAAIVDRQAPTIRLRKIA